MPVPTIVHLDADAFFVSVEQAFDPSLRGKKVAVGGLTRGIISSASYEARACGVYTPMPTSRALRVCPDLLLVRHTSGRYSDYSKRLFTLCETLTPMVEPRSVDEGFLDIGPCRFKSAAQAEAAVRALQARITAELQVTVSFGLAGNKLVAGIASKLNKPRGFTVVAPGTEKAFLAPLSVGRLPGIGPKAEGTLKAQGIERISQIQEMSEAELLRVFGTHADETFAAACGVDDSEVTTEFEDAKSYSQQETFARDLADAAAVEQVLKRMIDELMPKVRADGKRVRTLTIKVRYPDFKHTSAGHSIPLASDLEDAFYPHVAPLLRKAWSQRRPLRLVGAKLSGIEEQPAQGELFGDPDEKRRRLAQTLDVLKSRRGDSAVFRGSQIKG